MRKRTGFGSFRLRTKLLFAYLGLTAVLFSFGGAAALFTIKGAVQHHIEDDLRFGTQTIVNMVETAVQGSITNYLRAVAEKNLEIAHKIHNRFLAGEITDAEARREMRRVFLEQTIGKTGYIYCIDSKGVATVHPNEQLEGENRLNFEFVRKQTRLKTGYIEYQWKNPGEQVMRPKALYMTYFAPYDWIISVSTYRDEFLALLPMEEIRSSIKALTFGESGYVFVADINGNIIVHPELEGQNFYDVTSENHSFFKRIAAKKSGQITYRWKNPGDTEAREKIAVFGYIPEYEWIVGSTGDVAEINSPIRKVRDLTILFVAAAIGLSTMMTLLVSNSITRRLRHLMAVINKRRQGDLSARVINESEDEIGRLGRIFNDFLERLQTSHDDLTAEVSRHRETSLSLQQVRDFNKFIISSVEALVIVLDLKGRIVIFNRACEACSGYRQEEVLGELLLDRLIPEEEKEDLQRSFDSVFRTQTANRHTNHWVKKDGDWRLIQWSNTIMRGADGEVTFMVGAGLDITDQRAAESALRRMESQLLQSQKMDAIGTLAGGIAHDFNNSLQAISGYTQLLLMEEYGANRQKEMLATIQHSCDHARELTQQLLTFSRKIESKLTPLDLNHQLQSVTKLLRRTLPRIIDIQLDLADDLPIATADPVQFEQVLMNLSINAGHAMPDGGTLRIETRSIILGDAFCRQHFGAKPGPHAMLAISDTGIGMDEATRVRIFEPFFTTREPGSGTGLGLAMVYGIIKNHNGIIHCSSTPGRGTTFTIYLPAAKKVSHQKEESEDQWNIRGGKETILIVDDEPLIRQLGRELLEGYGYRVIETVDGQAALDLYRQSSDSIDLIVLDLNMPKMDGSQFLAELRDVDRDVPVLIASGDAPEGRQKADLVERAQGFVGKPYSLVELLKVVRETLDRAAEIAGASRQTKSKKGQFTRKVLSLEHQPDHTH